MMLSKKIACLIASVLAFAVVLSACSSGDQPDPTDTSVQPTSSPTATVQPTAEPTTPPPTAGPTPEVTPAPVIETWEGVYEKDSIILAVRNVYADSMELIIAPRTDYSAYSVSIYGVALIMEEKLAMFSDGKMTFYLELSGSQITISMEDGQESALLEGIYTRNDEDPYLVEIPDGITAGLPETVTTIMIDGSPMLLYIDPNGRFSAAVSPVFIAYDAQMQPEDGVCLMTEDEDAVVMIRAESAGGKTLQDYFNAQFPDADVEIIGDSAVAEGVFTAANGTQYTDIAFATISGDEIYTVVFTFPTAGYEYYSTQAAMTEIAVN